jgi:RimJ/RimL family protein N-acetyltransferase
MKYEQQVCSLKNENIVTIRMCREDDAVKLRDTIKRYLRDSPFIPMLPEEFVYSPEEQKQIIQRFAAQGNSLLLVAEYEGFIVGNIDLTGSQRDRMKHTAMIGMGMLEAWRGQGLGTVLMKQVMLWAKKNPALEQLWLEVYAENTAGLRLYKKFGFGERGRYDAFFKHNGIYSDKIMMGCSVK